MIESWDRSLNMSPDAPSFGTQTKGRSTVKNTRLPFIGITATLVALGCVELGDDESSTEDDQGISVGEEDGDDDGAGSGESDER